MSDRICQGYTSADAHLRILTSHLPVFVLLKTSLVLIHNKQSLYFLAYQSIIYIYFFFFFKIKPRYEISTNFLTEHLNQSAFWSGDSQAFAIIYLGFQSVESNCEAWLKKCDHLDLMTLSSPMWYHQNIGIESDTNLHTFCNDHHDRFCRSVSSGTSLLSSNI